MLQVSKALRHTRRAQDLHSVCNHSVAVTLGQRKAEHSNLDSNVIFKLGASSHSLKKLLPAAKVAGLAEPAPQPTSGSPGETTPGEKYHCKIDYGVYGADPACSAVESCEHE